MNNEKRKILGYKAPFDMFEGMVKKGSIFKPTKDGKCIYDCPLADFNGATTTCVLPIELIDCWEAVYDKEEEIVLELHNSCIVSIKKKRILIRDIVTDISSLKHLLYVLQNAMPRIGDNSITVQKFYIGHYDTFTVDDLKLIITHYDMLNKPALHYT